MLNSDLVLEKDRLALQIGELESQNADVLKMNDQLIEMNESTKSQLEAKES